MSEPKQSDERTLVQRQQAIGRELLEEATNIEQGLKSSRAPGLMREAYEILVFQQDHIRSLQSRVRREIDGRHDAEREIRRDPRRSY